MNNQTHKLKFRADALAEQRLSPQHLAVYYADGDSMEPRIHAGDAVLFDRSDTKPRHRKLYVVSTGGAVYVKRCAILDDGRVYFDSINPGGDHEWREARWMDNPKRRVDVLGRVRWIGSWER